MICYQIWAEARRQWRESFAECLREQRDCWPSFYGWGKFK